MIERRLDRENKRDAHDGLSFLKTLYAAIESQSDQRGDTGYQIRFERAYKIEAELKVRIVWS